MKKIKYLIFILFITIPTKSFSLIEVVLRSTRRVKRGIGTIRQDVNTSIMNNPRIEIKGFQELKQISKVIENEIKRQLELINNGEKFEPHVRKANADGTTSYLRPMPGSARLYPETDILPINVSNINVAEIIDINKKIKEYIALGLAENVAKAIIKANKEEVFDVAISKFSNLKPTFLAEFFISYPKEIKRDHNLELSLTKDQELMLLNLIDSGKITKDSIVEALINLNKGKFNIGDYEQVSLKVLEEEIKELIKKMPKAPFGAIMGKVMAKFKGRVDSKKGSEIIKQLL